MSNEKLSDRIRAGFRECYKADESVSRSVFTHQEKKAKNARIEAGNRLEAILSEVDALASKKNNPMKVPLDPNAWIYRLVKNSVFHDNDLEYTVLVIPDSKHKTFRVAGSDGGIYDLSPLFIALNCSPGVMLHSKANGSGVDADQEIKDLQHRLARALTSLDTERVERVNAELKLQELQKRFEASESAAIARLEQELADAKEALFVSESDAQWAHYDLDQAEKEIARLRSANPNIRPNTKP